METKLTGNTGQEVPVSEEIRTRIKNANASFRANQNISSFLEEGDTNRLIDEVTLKMEDVLKSLVIDTENDWNSHGTARRFAKMLINETYSGRYKPTPPITSFPNASSYDGIYVIGPITIRSCCSHHWQPIVGSAWIGVFPGKEVIGLSKFSRIVDHIASRPQIQEEMTTQIADELVKFTGTEHIAVVIKAEHFCMKMRGVKEACTDTTTAIMRGDFAKKDSLKDEFYKILSNMA